MRDLRELTKYRLVELELKIWGFLGGAGEGMFLFRFDRAAKKDWLRVIASSHFDWEHVSVSCDHRCPTWDEMERVKRTMFLPHETCMQLHVAEDNHISYHPYTLHIWRPKKGDIPTPPYWMVGPKPEDLEKIKLAQQPEA